MHIMDVDAEYLGFTRHRDSLFSAFLSAMASDAPSLMPSDAPSLIPSDAPSLMPSDAPSLTPSDAPSMVPSDSPSLSPSSSPSSLLGGQTRAGQPASSAAINVGGSKGKAGKAKAPPQTASPTFSVSVDGLPIETNMPTSWPTPVLRGQKGNKKGKRGRRG